MGNIRYIPHPCCASELKCLKQNMFWWNTWDVTKRRIIPPLHLFEPKKQWNSDIHYCGELKEMSNNSFSSQKSEKRIVEIQLGGSGNCFHLNIGNLHGPNTGWMTQHGKILDSKSVPEVGQITTGSNRKSYF